MARRRKKLGEMLKEEGLLTQAQLEENLAEQAKSGMRLGQFLINKGVFSEDQIVELISRQLKIERYTPENYQVDESLTTLIKLEFARQYNIAPLTRKHNLLYIAMTDPMDINAIDSVEILTNLEVEPVICSEQDLQNLFALHYDGGVSELGSMLQKLENMDTLDVDYDDDGDLVKDVSVSTLQDMAEEAPVVRLVNSLLAQALREGASDVHISPEKDFVSMRFRVDGKLKDVPAPPRSVFLPLVSRLKILGSMDIAVNRVPQDGRFSFQMESHEVHVRVSTIPTIYGENVVMRLLSRDAEAMNLDSIGLSDKDRETVESVAMKPYGMILSTGPTGSGKSTSLYAILKHIKRKDINILTLEDPVEYRVSGIRQVQLNRRAGMTFASGLRSALRQDPDVIMVGEIRDSETASIAVQAAMTGHKVLSTLHTNDSTGAVVRLVEMGMEPFLISSTLLMSMAQRLIRKVCDACKEPYEPSEGLKKAMGIMGQETTFYKGRGCRICGNSGFKGRVGVFEILVNDPMVQEMIMRRAGSSEIQQILVREKKLTTLKDDAVAKAVMGITTLEEAASAVLI